jgi:hypothetical protein
MLGRQKLPVDALGCRHTAEPRHGIADPVVSVLDLGLSLVDHSRHALAVFRHRPGPLVFIVRVLDLLIPEPLVQAK